MSVSARVWLTRFPGLQAVVRLLKGRFVFVPRGQFAAVLDYPLRCRPRWGYGKESHSELHRILNRNRPVYENTLRSFLPLVDDVAEIATDPDPARSDLPHWNNDMLPTLDGIAIYSYLALQERRLYVEVGSGNSTKFAHRAIRQHRRSTRIVSVDPCPRAEIDALCDEAIRSPLEDADLSLFDRLGAGDVLFVDNSHRSLMNSDATVFFLEVLPRLRPGVLVGIHDVCLPDDYPPSWENRYYSEQYLLACYLLAESNKLAIELPAWLVSHDPELSNMLTPLFARGPIAREKLHGCAFWFTISGQT